MTSKLSIAPAADAVPIVFDEAARHPTKKQKLCASATATTAIDDGGIDLSSSRTHQSSACETSAMSIAETFPTEETLNLYFGRSNDECNYPIPCGSQPIKRGPIAREKQGP